MAKLEPKIPQHLPGERDYGLERSFRRGFTQWPFNIAYGLNSFELFQGLNNFLIRTVNGFFGSLPGSHKLMDSNSYIETSLTLTRFRNYHDKEYSLEKAGNDKKKPPTTDKKNLLSLSLTSLKSSNLLWLKTSKISIQPLNCSNPLMEIIVFKNGSFKLLKHKRILQIYHEKIICYKNIEEKNIGKIHATIVFDTDLLVNWNSKQEKKHSKEHNIVRKFTGINLHRGTNFITFQSNDHKSLYDLKEILKFKLKFMNFYKDFELIKIIGKGAFCSVYLAENRITKEEFAVKVFLKRSYYSMPHGKELIINEIDCMRRSSDHPNILKLYEVYETHKHIFLVLELITAGNLQDRFLNDCFYTEKKVQSIMLGIFKAIKYLHSKNIMHRDLKPSNILFRTALDEEKDVCIADLGLATPTDVTSYIFYRCGTPGFAAPEIIKNTDPNHKYDKVCDIFSAGAIMHHLLTRKKLFRNKKVSMLFLNKECKINYFLPIYKRISHAAFDLLKKCLEKHPEKRITAEKALLHPFFYGLTNLASEDCLFVPNEKYDDEQPAIINNTGLCNNESFLLKKNFFSDKSSFALSKIHLEQLISKTPVLNGYLKSYEGSKNNIMQSHCFLDKSPCTNSSKSEILKSMPKMN